MEEQKIRVACYARYSSNMQREESITVQMRAMDKYCVDNGWVIVKRYADQAYSATTDKRPQFQKMIADSANKEFDVVLVHKLDRFARNRYDSCLYKHKLQKNCVRLCSVLERIDNTPESILLEGLIESINEFYSANLARESLKGLKENALKCLHNGGSAGLGYDVDDTGYIVINAEEAKIVAMIFSLYLCGYSCKKIAKMLNEEGYKTKAGKAFTNSSVYGILKNEKYTGIYIFNKRAGKGYDGRYNSHKYKSADEIIRIEGGIPAIISKDIWLKVQDKMSLKSGILRNTKVMYLLSGKIVCGVCGGIMRGSIRYRTRGRIFYMYRCNSKVVDCDNPKEIDRDSLEEFVVKLIQQTCDVDSEYLNTPHDSPKFRLLLQSYIDSVVICKRSVVVKLKCGEKIKSVRHKRQDFKTPNQRCFKAVKE